MADKKPAKKPTKKPTAAQAKKAAEIERKKALKAKADAAKARAEAARAKAEVLTGGHVGGFVDFIRQQGVVGLAVGLAIGTAAGDTVRKMVEGFIAPIVQFLVGTENKLENAAYTFEAFGRQAVFQWGAFVSSLITLLATALVIYLIIHFLKLDKLDKKKA